MSQAANSEGTKKRGQLVLRENKNAGITQTPLAEFKQRLRVGMCNVFTADFAGGG